ncbi:MAG: LamG domain-containing protein, partial [Planctomycetota bacterium]
EAFVYIYEARQQVIVRKNNSPSNGGIYYIDTRGNGKFGVRLAGPNGDIGDSNGICNDLTYDPNTWYHVALVWDGNNIKLYVNGQQSQALGPNSVSALPFTGPIGDSTTALGIGCIIRDNDDPPGNSGQFFQGRIDEVRISDKALSVSEFLHTGFAKMASNPSPLNGATNVCPEGLKLRWKPGEDAADVNGHDIYFGTSPNDVNESADPCVVGHDSNSWEPPIELGKTYYWRIDEVNDGNVWPGRTWQFTVEDGKVRDRSPADGYRGLPVDVNFVWTASCLGDLHDVYFGTDFNDVNEGINGTFKIRQAETTYNPDLEVLTNYHWRVDEVDDGNVVTKGDVWSFRTNLGGILMWLSFDGVLNNDIVPPVSAYTESGKTVEFEKYTADVGSVKYGAANTTYNKTGTSADFEPNAGLYRVDPCAPTAENPDILRLDGYQYTIELWVKPEGYPESGDMMLVGKGSGNTNFGGPWNIYINDVGPDWDNEFRWRHDNDSTGEEGAVVMDEWFHLAAVFDRTGATGDEQQLYINGELVADGGHDDLNPADNNQPVGIGAAVGSDGSFGGFFNGKIDELRILDVALKPSQFLYPFATEPSPFDGQQGIDPNDPEDPNVLSWTPWESADFHDVYFGTDYDSVRDATVGNDPNNVYKGRFDSLTYPNDGNALPLELSTIYFWRIDEVEGSDVYTGHVWTFRTEFVIIDPNLSLWYPFDEGEGEWVYDNSGHTLHSYDSSINA